MDKEGLLLKRIVSALFGCVLVVGAFWLSARPAKAQFSYLPTLHNGSLPLCRLGINGNLASYPIQTMRLGWFLDYSASARSRPRQMLSYFPMLRLEQTKDNNYTFALSDHTEAISAGELQGVVSSRPGSYWFIGNEPDRKIWQDDIEPQIYARAYHELYHLIKAQDPTAKIVAGAIVQPTPIRLQYLDIVLDTYQQLYGEAMPVDAWAFHNFILNEVNCAYYEEQGLPPEELNQICWGADIPPGINATDGMRVTVQQNGDFNLFKEQVRRFRQWMADRGYRNTPAFLSEFGILMPEYWYPEFSTAVVNQYMNDTFTFLLNEKDANIGYPADDNRLVQRFAWYSMDDKQDHNGFLFDRDMGTRTVMGDNFVAYANSLAAEVDVFPTSLRVVSTAPATGGSKNVTLEATIANDGNLAYHTPTTVRFYDANPNSGGEEIGSAQVALQGCGEQAAAKIQWNGVPPGNYTVFARADTAPGVENDEGNNLVSLPVTVSN